MSKTSKGSLKSQNQGVLVRDEYSTYTLTLTPHPNSIEEWIIVVNQDDSIRRTVFYMNWWNAIVDMKKEP